MKKFIFTIILMSLLSVIPFGSSALADCIYNGNTYTEGSVIGSYVCSNGQWQKR